MCSQIARLLNLTILTLFKYSLLLFRPFCLLYKCHKHVVHAGSIIQERLNVSHSRMRVSQLGVKVTQRKGWGPGCLSARLSHCSGFHGAR